MSPERKTVEEWAGEALRGYHATEALHSYVAEAFRAYATEQQEEMIEQVMKIAEETAVVFVEEGTLGMCWYCEVHVEPDGLTHQADCFIRRLRRALEPECP